MTKVIGFSPDKKFLNNISINKILLDHENPRLNGEDKKFDSEKELISYMYENYALDELAISMSQFGYFDAEPIVCIPEDTPKKFTDMSKKDLAKSKDYIDFLQSENTNFIVVEGNRRISTIKLLLNINGYKDSLNIKKDVFNKKLEKEVIDDLQEIPMIVYPRREDIIPYLGVKHIGGNKDWRPYPQALYIDSLINKGYSFDEVKNLMSDKSGKVIKNYLSLKLLNIAENNALDVILAKQFFSLLVLSIGQKSVKDYFGWPKNLNDLESLPNIIDDEHIENFKRYFKWIFGDRRSGRPPLIKESRDITNKLTKIIVNEKSLEYLEKTNDIEGAFERSDGEKDMILTGLKSSHRKISNLKDDLDLLLNKGVISILDIEDDIFLLEKNINDLKIILEKYNK